MGAADFPTFMGGAGAAGGTEGGPHNGVHGVIGSFGGPMGDYMSPLDPIFWLHHCNVDRIWAAWQELNPDWKSATNITAVQDGDGGTTTAGSVWLEQKLQGFYDLQGNPVPDAQANTPRNMLDISAPNLGYTYADLKVNTGATSASSGRRAWGRGLAAAAPKPTKVVAFTENSIIDTTDWENQGASATLNLKALVKGSKTEQMVNAYLSGQGSAPHFFRLKVAQIPRELLPGSTGVGPLMAITVSASDAANTLADQPLGDFNFFVPKHPPHKMTAGKHPAHQMPMGSELPAEHFNFGDVLDALKAKGFTQYPSKISIHVAFRHPSTGQPFGVTPDDFKNVTMKIIVVG